MIQPGVYASLDTSLSKKEYEYPLLELVDILEELKGGIWNERVVNHVIENFLYSLAYKNDIASEERNWLGISAKMGQWMRDGSFYECPSNEVYITINNLFTACLLYEYVPICILRKSIEWEYRDGTIVKPNGHSYDILHGGIKIKTFQSTEAEKEKAIENIKIYNEKVEADRLKQVSYPYSGTYNEKIEYLKSHLKLCTEIKSDELYEGRSDGSFTLFIIDGKFYIKAEPCHDFAKMNKNGWT